MLKFRWTIRQRIIGFVLLVNLLSGLLGVLIWSFFSRDNVLEPFLGSPLAPLFFTMLTAVPLSALVSKPTVKPFLDMIEATRSISKGNYGVRVAEEGEGEVRELLRSFNQMAAELENTELMRNDFINNFSHEFKTPITSILGFSRRLRHENLTDIQRREYLDYIVVESERLSSLSSNILLLSRYENLQIINGQQPFDLDEQLRRCVLLLENQWSAKHLELDIDLEPIQYTGSEEMLEHVWLNLLENAVKFSYPGGLIRLQAFRRDGAIQVSISDEGVGMDQNTIKHIYDRFFQGETAHSAEGNGLGLSLVHRIVELCGGRILVESAEKAGTTFHIILPDMKK